MWKYFLLAVLLLFLNISIMSPPAHGLINEATMFEMIPCNAEGNETYQNPTWMHHMWGEYNSVCDDDYFDWYAFPGEHPYYMQFHMKADSSIPGGANLSLIAEPLGIDMVNCGTLNSTDPVDWYFWDHPAGEAVDGFIEGVNLGHSGLSGDPPLNVVLYDSSNVELTNARLDDKEHYCTIDLEPSIMAVPYYLYEMDVEKPALKKSRDRE